MKRKLTLSLTMTCLSLAPLLAGENNLDSLKIKSLDEVKVYGTRVVVPLKKIPSKVELIQAPQIERSPVSNLGELLKYNSTIDIVQYPGFLSTIGMRGFTPGDKYVTILVNGIPTGTTNVSSLGINDVSQVEVLKGPFSAIYGTGAMGGVVNLVTRKSKDVLTGGAHLSYGSYNTQRVGFTLGGQIVENLSFDASLTYNKQGKDYKSGKRSFLSKNELEKIILDESTADQTKAGSHYDSFMSRIRLGYDFSPNWSLDIHHSNFIAKDLPQGGTHWSTDPLTGKDLERYSTALELAGKLGVHTLSLNPYYNIEKAVYLNKYDADDAIATYRSHLRTLGFLLQDNIDLGLYKVALGLDGQNMRSEGLSFDGTTGAAKKPSSPAYSTSALGAFAQSNMNLLNNRLSLSVGLRLDYLSLKLEANEFIKNTAKTETYFNITPNLGLKYELAKGLLLHASAGGGFRSPDAYQKSGEYEGAYGKTKGNPDLKPERSLTFDAGVGYSNRHIGLNVDVSYFHTQMKDVIYNVRGADKVKTFANGDKARMSGLEVLFSYDFGSIANNKFTLRAFTNATFVFGSRMYVKATDKWEDMRLVRKQNITFGLDFAYKAFELGAKGRYAGKAIDNNWNTMNYTTGAILRPLLSDHLAKAYPDLATKGLILMPQFMTFDLSAHYSFSKRFRLGIYLNNVLDEHYFEKDGYNMSGRNYMVGLSYKF